MESEKLDARKTLEAYRWSCSDLCRKRVAPAARKVIIQYGGSMNAGNCKGLMAQPDIDGGLIGGASLKLDFATIVNYDK